MDSKSLLSVEIKDAEKGEVEAVFATLNVKDKDDDVTIPGAFDSGAEVIISSYNHGVWKGALPVGKGVIHEVGDSVVMKGQFFMDTQSGRDTFSVVKALGTKQEWSYGFDVVDSAPGEHKGENVRYLKKMAVHEVSPVLRGAGIGTRTTYAKNFGDEISETVEAVSAAVKSAERVVALRAEKGKELSQVNKARLDELAVAVEKLKSLLVDTEQEDNTAEDDEMDAIWLSGIAAELESE